jgi:hypothetical protein
VVDFAIALVALLALGLVSARIAKHRRTPWRALFFSVPLLTVLVPWFGGSPQLRIEEALLFLAAPFLIIRKPVYRVVKAEILFLLYGMAIPISILMGYLLEGSVYYQDFFEFASLAKYWLIVRLATTLHWSERNISDGIWIFLWIGLIGACIILAQARNSFAINQVYTPLFIRENRLHQAGYRTPGTMRNGNIFGIFLTMASCVALSLLLFGRLSRKQKALTSAILTLLVTAITRTLSRGTIVALVVSFVVILWILGSKLTTSHRVIYIMMLIVGLATFAMLGSIYVESVAFSSGGEARLEGTSIEAVAYRFQFTGSSFSRRLADWQRGLEIATRTLLFGSGPSRDEEISYFHSEYVTHLQHYGLFGLAIYVLLMWTGADVAIGLLRRRILGGRFQLVLASSTLGVICVFALASSMYQVFQQEQLGAIFWWFTGMALAYSNSVRRSSSKSVCTT